MSKSKIKCIDCGSENCPCHLAETGDCIMCSRLQGKSFCDCNYIGVCIYNEYIQGGRRVNNPRESFFAEIIDIKDYFYNIKALTLKVPKGFAMKCSIPGSFLFVKAPDSPSFYQMPVSVMTASADNSRITIAIQSGAAKSKQICRQTQQLDIKGVYRNGILGLSGFLSHKENLVITAKGIATAPLFLLLNYLSYKMVKEIQIDTDKISEEFLYAYLPQEYYNKVKLIDIDDLFTSIGKGSFFAEDSVRMVLASDYYIKRLKELTDITACSNNFKLCCGEGVCGSCSHNSDKNNAVKMCKCSNLIIPAD